MFLNHPKSAGGGGPLLFLVLLLSALNSPAVATPCRAFNKFLIEETSRQIQKAFTFTTFYKIQAQTSPLPYILYRRLTALVCHPSGFRNTLDMRRLVSKPIFRPLHSEDLNIDFTVISIPQSQRAQYCSRVFLKVLI